MGKNPNAKKLKERKHRERTYSHDIEDLEEEAARRGLTVLELEQLRREEKGSSSSEESSEEEVQPQKKQKKLKKVEESSEEEEKAPVKKEEDEEEEDSDDAELEKMYGLSKQKREAAKK
jgi:hypothetical protein